MYLGIVLPNEQTFEQKHPYVMTALKGYVAVAAYDIARFGIAAASGKKAVKSLFKSPIRKNFVFTKTGLVNPWVGALAGVLFQAWKEKTMDFQSKI